MSFTETLVNIDEKILLAINGSHTPFLDGIMFYLSEKWILIPIYVLVIYFLQKYYGWKITGMIILGALLLIAASDLTATHLFKNSFMRHRPSHEPGLQEHLHYVNNYKGGQYGFYSSHASNMTALALYCGFFLKTRLRYYSAFAFTLVALISLSRIYLGVHYPTDILAGCMAGTVYAFLFIYIFRQFVSPKLNLQL